MHNFKKIICAVLAVCVAAALFAGLDFALYPCTFIRNDIHTVCGERFDDIYVGTSHGKMNIDPDAAEQANGRKGHNLCVGGEYSMDTYYLARLLLEKGKKPSRIVYEVSPGYFTMEKEEGNNYLLFYHEFPASKTKLQYFAAAIAECNFRTLLFPWYEYPLSYELRSLKDTVSKKAAGDYSADSFKTDAQRYHENGFIERAPVDPSTFNYSGITEFHEEDVVQKNMDYLEKLIGLCRENNIEFVAVTTPIPAPALKKFQEGYREAWAYFSDFFVKQDVRYINFNSGEYGRTVSHKVESFTDLDGHMNGEGARVFSRTLGEILG